LLRYYMNVSDPDSLSDQQWAMLYRDLQWIREEEAKANKG
jgi:hypothetical protein